MAMNPRLLRPTASGFDPRRISGIGAWFDATDASTLTLDTGVSEWRCKVTAGQKWTQSTGASQPSLNSTGINGKPAVSFDNTASQWMSLGETTIGGNTLFTDATNRFALYLVTFNPNGGTTDKLLLAKSSGVTANRHFQLRRLNKHIGTVARGSGNFTITAPFAIEQNTLVAIAVRWGGTTLDAFSNSQTLSITPGAAAAETSEVVTLGARTASSPTGFYDGLIGEVLFYNRVLSAAEEGRLYDYFIRKWGSLVKP